MKKLYIIIILSLMIGTGIAYTDSGVFRAGFNVWGFDINLEGHGIHNGTLNGTNFVSCNNLTQSSSWNNTGFECITINSTVDKNLSNYTNNPGFVTNATMMSDNKKVNKSGDNMTGYLEIQGMKIGDFQNYSTQGFSMVNTSYQGAFSVYNDTSFMYNGLSSNAYYDGVFSATQGWHKMNKSYASIITQMRSSIIPNDPFAGANTSSIDTYFSAPTTVDPFLNFDQVSSQTNTTTIFYKNVNIKSPSHLTIEGVGKGIQLTSPNGLATACITLNNAGVLITTAGVCT